MHLYFGVVWYHYRGHVEDIYDACWSGSSGLLVTGSVDNTAIIWDVSKGITNLNSHISQQYSSIGRCRVSFRGGGGGGGQRGHLPPLGSRVPPLDFYFILPHSLVVDAAPPYISNTLVYPP